MTKEQIYDTKINPLMSKIIAICKRHKIAMVASFSLSHPDEGLMCTTSLLDDSHDPPDKLLEVDKCLFRQRSPLMITTRNKDGKVVSMEAVL